MKKFIAILMGLAVLTISSTMSLSAEDSEINQPPGKVPAAVFDLLIVRPLAIGGALTSTSAFVAGLPVTFTLNRDLQSSEVLVHYPWSYAADRPLGILVPGKSITKKIDATISEKYLDYFVLGGANRSPLTIK